MFPLDVTKCSLNKDSHAYSGTVCFATTVLKSIQSPSKSEKAHLNDTLYVSHATLQP